MQYLKQSTAVTLKIGPFLDDTDGKTAETGLTIAQADVRLSKNGGDIAQKNEATSCTHDELGIYGCPIDATDTGTLGRLQLFVHESGALPVYHEFMVVTAEAYDTFCSTDHWTVDLNDDAITSAKFDESTAFPLKSADTGATAVARTGADSDTLETLSDQIDLQATSAELAKVPKSDGTATWNATALASINAECDTALTDYDAPTKAEMDSAFTEIKGATWSSLTDTLELIRDKQTDIETDTQDLQTQVGVAGAGLTAVPWNASWDAEVQSECTDALNAYDSPTKAELDSGLAGLNDPTAAAIADAVCDEALAGHAGAGTVGKAISDILADTNELQTNQGDWATAVGFSTHSAADVKTAIEASGSDLDYLVKALVNKVVITEANGNTEMFNDANASLGTIASAITSDGTYTTRLRMVV